MSPCANRCQCSNSPMMSDQDSTILPRWLRQRCSHSQQLISLLLGLHSLLIVWLVVISFTPTITREQEPLLKWRLHRRESRRALSKWCWHICQVCMYHRCYHHGYQAALVGSCTMCHSVRCQQQVALPLCSSQIPLR